MNIRQLSLEQQLYILAFGLALGLRLFNLGGTFLSESEASLALQAMHIFSPSQSESLTLVSPQAGYLSITGLLFATFGASNTAARLVPALAGACLALAPWLFRRQLGRLPAVILAFGLAVDPGLVAVSRQAGSTMLALTGLLFCLGWMLGNRMLYAGIAAGAALLAGPSVVNGLISLGAAWLAWQGIVQLRRPKSSILSPMYPFDVSQTSETGWRDFAFAAGGTTLLAGTLFLAAPVLLSPWGGTIASYFHGWVEPSGIPAWQLALALMAYQPLAILFAAIGIGKVLYLKVLEAVEGLSPEGQTHSPNIPLLVILSAWMLTALLLSLLYPARQTADLIWVLAPLWALAAVELADLKPEGKPHTASIVLAGAIFLLLALFWNTFAALNYYPMNASAFSIRLTVIIGILMLGVLITGLVAMGWSWQVGRFGLSWGASLALASYTISVMWGATQLRPNLPQELWSQPPGAGQAGLLLNTLRDLSNWETGDPKSIQIVSYVDNASLIWALRDFINVNFSSSPAPELLSAVIIAPEDQDLPALTASYRGQDFTWGVLPGWQDVETLNIFNWLVFHEAPLKYQKVILWARSDLFLEDSKEPEAVFEGSPEPQP